MNFLEGILVRKKLEVENRRRETSEAAIEGKLSVANLPKRSLRDALSGASQAVRIIAEIKRASPSAGTIASQLDAPRLASRYAEAGATAISVLTDGPGFSGSIADLRAVRTAVGLPLLAKDFFIERYQLVEARLAGADVALLIVAALTDVALADLLGACASIGLEALVEVHDEEEVQRALACGADIIGVNNRDLATFEVDISVSERLLPFLPARVRRVVESGVRGPEDVARLRKFGASNFLVGEALVRAANPQALLGAMVAVP